MLERQQRHWPLWQLPGFRMQEAVAPLVALDQLAPTHPHTGLEVLDLGRNSWARVPPALAAATSLTDLSLANNPSLVWSSADVDTLSQMPRLRRLHLDDSSVPEHLLGLLSQRMPHLQITR